MIKLEVLMWMGEEKTEGYVLTKMVMLTSPYLTLLTSPYLMLLKDYYLGKRGTSRLVM